MNNQAFIDGQNLTLSTRYDQDPWKIDLYKFRKYLKEKYNISKAYYFLGYRNDEYLKLYNRIRNSGFIIVFRAHNEQLESNKKGNVDTDIVFMMMKSFHEKDDSNKIFLVSGDGDYYRTIIYLKRHGRLGKILFPAHFRASSLYRHFSDYYYDYLDSPIIRKKIELKEQK